MVNQNSKKFLCLRVSKSLSNSQDGSFVAHKLIPELSKCPANPEMLMAALQFLTDDMVIQLSISDKAIDFTSEVDK